MTSSQVNTVLWGLPSIFRANERSDTLKGWEQSCSAFNKGVLAQLDLKRPIRLTAVHKRTHTPTAESTMEVFSQLGFDVLLKGGFRELNP